MDGCVLPMLFPPSPCSDFCSFDFILRKARNGNNEGHYQLQLNKPTKMKNFFAIVSANILGAPP